MKINPSDIRIRQAVPDDAAAVAAIESWTSPEPWSEAALLHDISTNDRSIVIVAETRDGTCIGYADIWKVADEIQLNNIAVLEEYRGNHIAAQMLGILADAGRELGCSTMNLEVRASNESAIRLYTRCGFRQVGVREGYYIDNGEDAILMDLAL